jgi:hypothetical protein
LEVAAAGAPLAHWPFRSATAPLATAAVSFSRPLNSFVFFCLFYQEKTKKKQKEKKQKTKNRRCLNLPLSFPLLSLCGPLWFYS